MDELRERIALLEKRIDELEGSEGRYRVLIDNAFEGVWAVDSEWKTTFVNKRMADMLGYEPEEMIGQVVTAFVEQSNRSVIDGIIERCHNNVGDVYDLNFLSKNGNVIRTRVSASALLDGNERFAGAMALVSDVTARKGMEEALKDSEQRYRVLSESTFEGIVIHNNGIVLDVNQAALDQAGYTREEVLGRSVLDFFGPESRKGIETAISKPVVEEYETDFIKKDGERRTMRIKAREMEYHGQAARVATFMDVTDLVEARRNVEELLQRKEEESQRLHTILNTLPVGVVIVNHLGQVQQSNVRAAEIWGPVTDLHPKNVKDYRSLKGWWADTGIPLKAEDWTVAKALRENRTIIGDMIDIERMDGSRGCILNSAAPLQYDGNVVGGVVVTEDITTQRKLEHEAIAAKERAELYIDLLTHDINNMNAAARGYLQLMGDKTQLDERAQKRLSKGLSCLDDISDLIEKVKKIQKIDGSEGRRELVDLGWVIEDAVQTFNFLPGKNVIINFEPQMKRLIWANELITDVFTNLIGNSIKHSDGPVTIDIVLSKAFYEGREYYLVSVEDNGPGIPDDAKGRVFSRLQRGKTKATGSGLGLFLVRRLVEDFNGRVWVEDRVPGDHAKGARFVMLLPVAISPDTSL